MSDTQWVQHKSGVGEKLQLVGKDICQNTWVCWGEGKGTYVCYLPKSEYVPCDPPERWVDVTASLVLTDDRTEASESCENVWAIQCLAQKYRLRKVQFDVRGWAFIVEKKES